MVCIRISCVEKGDYSRGDYRVCTAVQTHSIFPSSGHLDSEENKFIAKALTYTNRLPRGSAFTS